jgi:hypothetical protein
MEATLSPSPKRMAHYAGFSYLFLVITAPLAHIYIPSVILDRTNSAITAQNLLANELLFRMGIVLNVLGLISFILTVLFLYELLRPVNERLARLMRTLVLVGIPVAFLLAILRMSAMLILKSEVYTSFERSQVENFALMLFRIGDYGGYMEQLFWGLWLFPFGMLVYRSGFIPKLLGVWLIANGFAYLVLSLLFVLFPQYLSTVSTLSFPLIVGELWIMLWLVIKGVREPKSIA